MTPLIFCSLSILAVALVWWLFHPRHEHDHPAIAKIAPPPPVRNEAAPRWEDVEFDVEGQPIVSIERTQDQSTLIGLRLAPGELYEWYLPASPEKHAELVRRFSAKIVRANAGNAT